ncbi:recombinase family protein [Phenylobacterium montanum]|uniref:Recombinase family protein n=1 Tax=Phenylobacterium montanum TaxID=2823693 RepID=A0A975G470_9CAUL|nr:recombinase family protein [Caulobacter sp. S6]QUD90336.1 recombinase family protein [Caulobacter sp. S6]
MITRAQAATRIGYAGLSKAGSGGLAGAVAMLRAAGCARIFEERSPGGRWNRPALDGALRALQPGDTLVAPSLDHLSRSMNDLLLILSRVEAAGAGFRSIDEEIDTTSGAGRLMMKMLGSLTQFSRAKLHERTEPGLRTAQAEGRRGRPPKFKQEQADEILALLASGLTAAEVARRYGVHRATICRLEELAARKAL